MSRSEDLVVIGLANAAILDEQIRGVFGEVWSQEDTEGRGTVGLKGSGNLCGLDLRDDVEGSVVGADAEGD